MTETTQNSTAGGPPRFYVLLALPSGALLAGTCGRGIARVGPDDESWIATTEAPRVVNGLAIAADGTLVTACEATGLHRSVDDGRSWTPFALDGQSAYSVVAGDPLLVGMISGGLRASEDGGRTWTNPAPALSTTSVYRIITLADGRALAATDGAGVWATGPRGWFLAGLDEASVFALCQLPDGRVLAGTRGGGVQRSDDGGLSWSSSSVGLPDPIVHTIVVTSAGDVYAGTGAGVAHSRDRGETWTAVGDELAHHRIFSLAVDRAGSVFAGSYDGVWVNRAGDTTWVAIDTGLAAGEAFSVFADDRVGTWAGAKAGAIRSLDGGVTWTRHDTGAKGLNEYAFVVDSEGTLLAATDDGVRALTESPAGPRWTSVGLAGRRAFSLLDLGGGELLAGTLGDGLHLRHDGSWQRVGERDLPPLVFDLRRSTLSGAVLAATGAVVDGIKTGGICRSTDEGRTWTTSAHEPITVYRIVETATGVLFAGAQGSCILCSVDGGATWIASSPAGLVGSKMYCLAIDRSDRLYLGSGAKLLRSAGLAASWQEIGEGLDGVTTYGLTQHSSGALIAATSSGMYRSDDDAVSWHPIDVLP
jgi:photosystem II stability/assembly factor-like uncharacterized protein